MSRLTKFIEELFFPILAAVSLLISVADLFGLFRWIPADKVPMLILLLVALALNSLGVIQRRVSEIHERTQLLLTRLASEQLENEVIEQIDPELRRVLQDDYFSDTIGFLNTAIKESKVPINDTARFRHYYLRTLQSFSRATFLSTSSVSAFSLWTDHAIEKATANFIRSGGKMKQIFFVKNMQEYSLPTTRSMIDHLQEMGMQVYIVNGADTAIDLKKNFIVEARGKIAWEIHMDSEGHSGANLVTTQKSVTDSYCRAFEKLYASAIHK